MTVAAVALVLFAGQAASRLFVPEKLSRALRQSECSGDDRFLELPQECLSVLAKDGFGQNLTVEELDVLCVADCIGPVNDIFQDCIPEFADLFVTYCSKDEKGDYCGYLLEVETANAFVNETLTIGYEACGGANYTTCPDLCKKKLEGLTDKYGCCFEEILMLVLQNSLADIVEEMGLEVILPHFIPGEGPATDDLWVECGLKDPGVCPIPDGVNTTATPTATPTTAMPTTAAAATTRAGATVIGLFLALLMF